MRTIPFCTLFSMETMAGIHLASVRKVQGPQVSVLSSVDRIYLKMSDTVTVTDLKLATRQREGFKEKLAQLQMNKAKKPRFMTQEEQKTQIQILDDLANRRAKPVLLNGMKITNSFYVKFSRLV